MLLRSIGIATVVAGTLDLLAAFYFAGAKGMGPVQVLQFVASGPLGDVAMTNPAYAVAGLLVHFAIMACMAAVLIVAASRLPLLRRWWLSAGIGYGLILWFVMYWIVRPMRWASLPPPTDPTAIAEQLFCHILLVGLPIAYIASRSGRQRRESSGGTHPETAPVTD